MSDEIKRAIAAIEKAQRTWDAQHITVVWAVPRSNSDNSEGLNQSKLQVLESASLASQYGDQAIDFLKAGNIKAALEKLNDSVDVEMEYGEALAWQPAYDYVLTVQNKSKDMPIELDDDNTPSMG